MPISLFVAAANSPNPVGYFPFQLQVAPYFPQFAIIWDIGMVDAIWLDMGVALTRSKALLALDFKRT